MESNHPLLKTIFANEHDLLDQVKELIFAGADPNERTEYFETPLRVSSRLGRFDVVQYLFESGADPSHLNWTPIFHAVAYGSIQQVKDCLDKAADLDERDTWERTPILLAIESGDIDKVCCLLNAGANLSDAGRCGKSALEYAIQMDNADMLTFLVQKGVDLEAYNHFGYTPLMQAAEDGAINCVKCLLRLGADIHKTDRSQFSQKTAIAHASTVAIANILATEGDDLNQLDDTVRASLLGIGKQEKLAINKKEYLAQKHRKFGLSNPQKCDTPFWYDMVRTNATAWRARDQFDDTDSFNDQPVWCYERFGKSITPIGDNEFIEIAGEHEDSYDTDFCIYNEVFHHLGDGEFTIYQYPENLFPPTDFHTATLVNGHIYIIGNLGYPEKRAYGATPVHRLNIQSFEIEKVETLGDCPGWIYNHSAYHEGQSTIRIQGGEILEKPGEKESHRLNTLDFELDLETLKWTKHDHIPKTSKTPFLPGEYKRFSYSDNTLVALEAGSKWQIIKIISVYRIDVTEGDEIRFEDETLTALSDDFLYAVAYSTSELFVNYDQLEKAVADKTWAFEVTCNVCRTTAFPEYSRYIGFGEKTPAESKAFDDWKAAFAKGASKIA